MAYTATQFGDCQTIIKTFERSAAYCPTEESVYAMLTVPLQNMRTSAGSFVKQSELMLSSGDLSFDKATEDDGIGQIQDAFTDTSKIKTWYKNCLHCDIRIGSFEELLLQVAVNGFEDPFLDALEQMYLKAVEQIEKMKELFNGDPYMDLCLLIKWLKDFVCLPDLASIVAALMALLSKIAFDFGGVVGILISLVAPLIQPFLTNLVNSLQQYLFMVLKPIECIIEKFQKLLSYGDVYQAMEANLASVNLPFTTRRDGKTTGKALGVDLHEEGNATKSGTEAINQLVQDKTGTNISIQDRIDARRAENQQKVDEAAKVLENLEKSGGKIDLTNPKEVEEYNKKKKEAKKNYQDAVDKRDLSAIQRANKRISTVRQEFRSLIVKLMNYLREAIQFVESYINQLWDELKKLTLEFGGGHNSFIADLIGKMEIVQLIQLVYALIKNGGLKGCDDIDDQKMIESILDKSQSSLAFWVDEDGNMHLEDTNDGLFDAIDEVVETFGFDPNQPIGDSEDQRLSSLANTQDLAQADKGNYVTEAMQKLNSLIQLTGDPVLDSQIARATEAVTSRTDITFKCPLQTSVQNAEQVNKWINELNK